MGTSAYGEMVVSSRNLPWDSGPATTAASWWQAWCLLNRASTYGHDQVDVDAQAKREETAKAGVDQTREDCVDSNHVAPDAPG